MSFTSTRMSSTKRNDKLNLEEKLLANILNQMAFAIFGNLKHLHCLIHGLVKLRGESEKRFVKNAVRKSEFVFAIYLQAFNFI